MLMSFNIDISELQADLEKLAHAARVEPGKVLKEEVKYLVRSIMRLTPPSSFSEGRKAVAADLGKVYTTLPAIIKQIGESATPGKEGFQASIIRASKFGDWEYIRQLLTGTTGGTATVRVRPHTRASGSVAGYTQTRTRFRPMIAGITPSTTFGERLNPEFHTRRRNNRGHVGGGGYSQVLTKQKELSDYRKKIQSRVGWHMAGWALLARLVGEKVPAWVSKTRLESVSGTASVNFGWRPFVHARNIDVKIPKYQRTIQGAVNFRMRITAKKLDAVLQGRAVNLGFTRIGAKK